MKHAFLANEWNFVHLTEKKLNYLEHLKDFLNFECESHLKQSLTSLQHKIIVAYCTSNDVTIDIDWWSTISISKNERLC